MLRFFALLVLAGGCSACLSHAKARPTVEEPDPVVGDMSCTPPMSIHALLEAWTSPDGPHDPTMPMHCERG